MQVSYLQIMSFFTLRTNVYPRYESNQISQYDVTDRCGRHISNVSMAMHHKTVNQKYQSDKNSSKWSVTDSATNQFQLHIICSIKGMQCSKFALSHISISRTKLHIHNNFRQLCEKTFKSFLNIFLHQRCERHLAFVALTPLHSSLSLDSKLRGRWGRFRQHVYVKIPKA